MDLDAVWCPTCDKLIVPKRIVVNIPTGVQHPPPPPPPSPQRRTKANLGKKHGLVAGTGRVRHNGTIKAAPAPPTIIYKQRTVIDQGPTPLYCSDECHMADINKSASDAPTDPVREESKPQQRSTPVAAPQYSPSMMKLARFLNFPALPPHPVVEDEPEEIHQSDEYESGTLMASRLIASMCPKPRKANDSKYPPPPEEHKIIPGWNDGSHAWRSTVYSFSAPKSRKQPFDEEKSKAYGSCTASAHRMSRGTPSATAPAPAPSSSDMIAKYSQSFTRRTESRLSLYGATPTPGSPSSAPTVSQSPKRERSLVHAGAQGKLLVPDVKLTIRTSSSASLSSVWSGPTTASSRRSVRSPLSATSDSDSDDSSAPQRRPTIETRSWSYDNVKTYPLMDMPTRKVKRIVKQIIDGEEREIEEEVNEEPKRLFLFRPSRVSC